MADQTENHSQNPEQKKESRPVFVTLVAVVVFFLAADNLLAVSVGFTRGAFFSDLPLALPMWVLIVFSVIKGVAYLVIALGLWFRWSAFKMATIITIVVLQIFTLSTQVFFVQGIYESGRLIFSLASALILDSLLIMGLLNPNIKTLFGQYVQKESINNDT